MKRFIETIKNILKIEELKSRLLLTFLLVVFYRFGSYVALPGVDVNALSALSQQTEGGLMMLLDMFSGGAFSRFSIFAMTITPYITASIVIQLLGMVIPSLERLMKEGGEEGRNAINKYTKLLR